MLKGLSAQKKAEHRIPDLKGKTLASFYEIKYSNKLQICMRKTNLRSEVRKGRVPEQSNLIKQTIE